MNTTLAPSHRTLVLTELVEVARARGSNQLLEHESLALAGALGLAVPHHALVMNAEETRELNLADFFGTRLVVKAVALDLAHKTELGAIAVTRKTATELESAVRAMAARLEGRATVVGYLVLDFVEHDHEPGGELLLSLRHSREFGPLVTLSLGGVTAEALGGGLNPAAGPLILSPALLQAVGDRETQRAWVQAQLESHPLGTLFTGASRGREPRVSSARLTNLLVDLCAFALEAIPSQLDELEINPLTFVDGEPFVLDSLARVARVAPPAPTSPRQLDAAAAMLTPKSICIMGVSSKGLNPGRIILQNTLAAGFDAERLSILRPGCAPDDTIDGVTCVPGFEALVARIGGPVDVLALTIPAAKVPGVIEELCATGAARGVVLIPGGLGERAGTGEVARDLAATVEAARERGTAPVINGGNCLGLRSLPGRLDTLFIPHEKLPLPRTEDADPVALLSQSGAFAIARISNLGGSDHDGPAPAGSDRTRQTWGLAPRYVVTMGNQLDLTMGDWLAVVERDPAVRTIGCYVEGFKPGDGLAFARVVQRLCKSGRRVVLYRAGRSAEGAAASASHTASLAGDPVATRALVEAAGGLFAESIEDFEDQLRLGAAFASKPSRGRQLGVISNAGFECVAIADNLGGGASTESSTRGLTLARLSATTNSRLEELFDAARLSGFVDVHHPLDVTPIADDEAFVRATELLLDDEGVDLALVGCVPLSAAIATLPEGALGDVRTNNLADARAGAPPTKRGITGRLIDLAARHPKPFAVVVDSGPLYDTFATTLARGGIPVFRTADRATRAFGRY
jgi:acyl-CoA synthetase (NDP forming)